MKASLLCSATLFGSAALAFPANLFTNDISDETLAQINALVANITDNLAKPQTTNVKRQFDADAQRVDTTGEHAYQVPGPNDIRGPCPGLNTMANHGYISRSGVTTILYAATASNKVFGQGIELSTFLAVYSSVVAGDLTTFSIGGKAKSGGLLTGVGSSLGLIGEPQGLSNSHNRFECDASPFRADYYATGDPVSLNIAQFEEFAAKPLGPNGYDLSVIIPWRRERIQNSVATNGRYFAGPWTHIVVNVAAHVFLYRYFANFTAEYPEGYLDLETLKTFNGVTGEQGSFEWASGREKIPDNWYRRPIGDDYGLVGLNQDALAAVLKYPDLIRVGGNTGEPNTFVGVDLDDLTGGVFNAQTLLEGNNMVCFAMQFINIGSPDILKGLVGNVLQAVSKLTDALKPILQTLSCPQVSEFNGNLFEQFPGAGSGL
ncbi:hypothetical protein DE146DRAFT_259165 [Phaeosphaeria sp. MPI-PUGE-AT-0046c]|nr:hypothetical protein DE146DRAFT_259165 [Phaeosphaeria sp. MPI-PUGE-AT-0046c]